MKYIYIYICDLGDIRRYGTLKWGSASTQCELLCGLALTNCQLPASACRAAQCTPLPPSSSIKFLVRIFVHEERHRSDSSTHFDFVSFENIKHEKKKITLKCFNQFCAMYAENGY